MTTLSSTERPPGASGSPAGSGGPARRGRRRLGDRLLFAYTWAVIIWLALPIGVMIAFSFNNPHGRYNFTWVGFTLKWYGPHLFDYPSLTSAIGTSLIVAVSATIGAVILGTLVGLALGKYRFRGLGTANLVQFAAIAAPEIVLASSLLSFFVTLRVPLGLPTIIVAHIMFCLSFVVVTVRSRLAGMSDTLEQASADLYATPRQTFWRITFPLVFPGILGAALLAFSLSFDDFIITNLHAGNTTTFPMYVWGVQRKSIPMQVNVIGTLMLVISILIVVGGEMRNRARQRALAGEKPTHGRARLADAAPGLGLDPEVVRLP